MQQTLISWFDFVTIIMLGAGIWVGRRRGMSAEILDLILWLGIVALGALSNAAIGSWLHRNVQFSVGTSHVLAYLLVMSAVLFLGFAVRRQVGAKLVSADTFGSFEYYLGMVAGAVRFLCMLLAAMAILHGPYTSQEELNRKVEAQRRDLGEIYFPPFGQIQNSIFKSSLTGRMVERHLYSALISTDPGSGKGPADNIYRSRERDVDEAGGLQR
jgi:uncharacterized membrane protein required for colicin V production